MQIIAPFGALKTSDDTEAKAIQIIVVGTNGYDISSTNIDATCLSIATADTNLVSTGEFTPFKTTTPTVSNGILTFKV
jgi:hypothetical protein